MTVPGKDNPESGELLRVLQRIEAHLTAIRHAVPPPARQWFTVDEVAEELHVSRDTVERLIAGGKLRAAELTTQAGRGARHRYRIRRDWVDAFLTGSVRAPQKPVRENRRSPKLRSRIDFIG